MSHHDARVFGSVVCCGHVINVLSAASLANVRSALALFAYGCDSLTIHISDGKTLELTRCALENAPVSLRATLRELHLDFTVSCPLLENVVKFAHTVPNLRSLQISTAFGCDYALATSELVLMLQLLSASAIETLTVSTRTCAYLPIASCLHELELADLARAAGTQCAVSVAPERLAVSFVKCPSLAALDRCLPSLSTADSQRVTDAVESSTEERFDALMAACCARL